RARVLRSPREPDGELRGTFRGEGGRDEGARHGLVVRRHVEGDRGRAEERRRAGARPPRIDGEGREGERHRALPQHDHARRRRRGGGGGGGVVSDAIADFLAGTTYAVVGASKDRWKYGNKVLRCYLQKGRKAIPVNPRADVVEGIAAVPDLASLPEPVHGASIITQPEVTERIVEEAAKAGITRLWMQPGAESERAIERAPEL